MSESISSGPVGPESPGTAVSGGASLPANLEAVHPSVPALRARFDDAILGHELVAGDEHIVYVDPARNFEILQWLKDDPDHRYTYLSDVTAVDYGGGRPLQVVYQLFSIPHRRHLRIKAELSLDALEIESVVPLWQSANWLEREVWDMFGVTFRNHPDPRRILMPEGYEEGHPLRKDFPLRGRFTRAEQTRRALSQDPEDYYVPSELAGGREPQLVPWQEFAGGRRPMSTTHDSTSTPHDPSARETGEG